MSVALSLTAPQRTRLLASPKTKKSFALSFLSGVGAGYHARKSGQSLLRSMGRGAQIGTVEGVATVPFASASHAIPGLSEALPPGLAEGLWIGSGTAVGGAGGLVGGMLGKGGKPLPKWLDLEHVKSRLPWARKTSAVDSDDGGITPGTRNLLTIYGGLGAGYLVGTQTHSALRSAVPRLTDWNIQQ